MGTGLASIGLKDLKVLQYPDDWQFYAVTEVFSSHVALLKHSGVSE